MEVEAWVVAGVGVEMDKFDLFPQEEAHCAYLAAETLQKSLQIYMRRQTGVSKVNSGKYPHNQ